MRKLMEQRVLKESRIFLDGNSTVRQVAKQIGYSKSTVYLDLTRRLEEISTVEAEKVRNILNKNRMERHIRGGMATREKYKKIREKTK